MIETLNACKVDLVCLGNHETDIAHPCLLLRIQESQFVWVNTNLPDLPMQGLPPLPEYHLVPLFGGDINDPKCPKVAFLGLLTDDPSLYRPDNTTFCGAKILPVIPTAAKFQEMIKQKHQDVSLILPMTHQFMAEDRKFARAGMGFPLVLGGHDHEPFHEVVEGCTILKVTTQPIPSFIVTQEVGGGGGGTTFSYGVSIP